ncbi:MAG: type VI secretion system tip protein VgrG [Polyangiaceae bacterium]|nr:type VI secretion system tip protein VgrG [Polyangiaceae bacterium]
MSRNLAPLFQIDDTVAERIVSFELTRELGRPAALDIEVRFSEDLGPENALGKLAYLGFGFDGEDVHEFAGVIESVTVVGSPSVGGLNVDFSGSAHNVKLRVVSQLGLLGGSVTARIFQDKDVKEIVTQVLEDHGIATTSQKWQTTGTYAKREYCVQYFESSLDFVSRLLEEEGIYFFSVVEEGAEMIVFADDSPSSDQIDGDKELPFRGQLGFSSGGDAIFGVRELAKVRSGKFTLRDYDFKRPSLDMTVDAQAAADTNLERYDFPGMYVEPSVGKQLAKVRLEAEQVDREVTEILCECPRIHAGRLLTIGDAPLDDMVTDVCAIKVIHAYGSSSGKYFADFGVGTPSTQRAGDTFVTVAKLIAKDVKYRTPQTTPRPVIHGPQTARVVAPQGSEPEAIHTDEHGRCKVKFHWDLGPDQDDKASCWIRTAQMQTSGSMILPRIDWEVVVEFVEGNPDRPLVTGKLYNGKHMPPYALPEGKTRTSMQTRSTPGGGGTNEIRMEDRAGGEEIMIHAQHNQTIATANDKKTTVGNNATRVVSVNETITVGGNQTTKITMGSQTTVGADQTISVGGNRNTEVNAVAAVTASGSSATSVGGNHFEMDGNPLEALLNIAAEVAIQAAQAAASAALDRVNAAVQSRVDQVMAPVNNMTAQMDQIGAGMQAVANGDMGAVAGLASDAAGLPMPPGFGGAMGRGGGDAAGGGAEAGRVGGDGGGGGGRDAGGGGGDGGGASYTAQLGIDSAVNSAISSGIHGGVDALGSALGLDPAGQRGEGAANADGPAGDVPGVDQTDRAKGPGHNTHKVGANLDESSGSLRIQAALTGITSDVGGNVTETIGLAKVTGTFGATNETTAGNKTVNALGQIVFAKAGESENAGGNATNMVGGLVYDNIKGSYSVEGGGPATFIGAFHKWEAATSITFKAGASEVVIDGSGVTITSPIVAVLSSKIQLTKSVSQV